jgi:topoisomerase IV subunit B
MYIGRIGDGSHYDDGCYILLKEVIDNAIDEYIMGHGKEVQINIEGTAVSVRDFGRGIPLGKVVDCVSKINTGAKYNDDVFQFSVGLNGVGTKAVNALSKDFFVRSHRGGEFAEASLQDGQAEERKNRQDAGEPDGTFIRSSRTRRFSRTAKFRPDFVERRLRHYSYLNTGLKLIYNGQSRRCFSRANGLMDLVMEDLRRRQRADLSAAALREQDAGVLFHAQQQPLRRDVLFLRQRPVHQRRRHASERLPRGLAQGGQRIRQGQIRGRRRARVHGRRGGHPAERPGVSSRRPRTSWATRKSAPNWSTPCARSCCTFSTATRRSPKKSWPRSRTPSSCARNCRRSRSWRASGPRPSPSASRSSRIAKFISTSQRQGPRHDGLHLTEGQSAAGSIVSCRDVNNQAVFVLKGKPLNVWDLKRDIVYKNDEMYNLMRSLDIEDNSKTCATKRSSSPPTRTWTACTSAI